MPPSSPLNTGLPQVSPASSLLTTISAQLPKAALFVFLFISCFRLALVIQFRKTERGGSRSTIMDENDQKQDSMSLERPVKKETPPTETEEQDETAIYKPVYPWTSPPIPLPGPYDPPYYPLPTLRRHSSSDSTSTTTSTEHGPSAELYSRRVSTNSIPTRDSILRGTVTTSHEGWRRNQWVLSDG